MLIKDQHKKTNIINTDTMQKRKKPAEVETLRKAYDIVFITVVQVECSVTNILFKIILCIPFPCTSRDQ